MLINNSSWIFIIIIHTYKLVNISINRISWRFFSWICFAVTALIAGHFGSGHFISSRMKVRLLRAEALASWSYGAHVLLWVVGAELRRITAVLFHLLLDFVGRTRLHLGFLFWLFWVICIVRRSWIFTFVELLLIFFWLYLATHIWSIKKVLSSTTILIWWHVLILFLQKSLTMRRHFKWSRDVFTSFFVYHRYLASLILQWYL